MELQQELLLKYGTAEPSSEGLSASTEELIDYAIAVYTKTGDHLTLNDKKDAVIETIGLCDEDGEILKANKSVLVSKIITDVLRANADRQFELYISALEAATILLEVVRRPIDDSLEDEKWLAALKSKKQGFTDADELIRSASKIAEEMLGTKEVDVEKHVEVVHFKKGMMEKLAEKNRRK